MTDIAKCVGETTDKRTCPMRAHCYRYTAEAGQRQSWIEAPLDPDDECELFWDERVESA
jgi:hypothetical protein